MKKILVPCDFSTPSVHAFRFALDLVSQSKGVVHVLHVIELPVLHDTLLMPVLNFEVEFFKEMKKQAEIHFGKVNKKYNTSEQNVVFEIQFGGVHRMVQDYIGDRSIDLVAIGSHGATGLHELFLGSNAQKVVRHSPVPVIVVKDYLKKRIRNIVFPNTLETVNQEELIRKVKALQDFFGAHLDIVWINTPSNFVSDTISRQRLELFVKRFMFKNYSINLFSHTDEEKGILAFAESVGADLIAMGTRGRTGILHVLNGSLAEDVVNHTPVPVWTYCERSPAGQD